MVVRLNVQPPKEPLAQVIPTLIDNALKHHDQEEGLIELKSTTQ